jgi:hypothetical protein
MINCVKTVSTLVLNWNIMYTLFPSNKWEHTVALLIQLYQIDLKQNVTNFQL